MLGSMSIMLREKKTYRKAFEKGTRGKIGVMER